MIGTNGTEGVRGAGERSASFGDLRDAAGRAFYKCTGSGNDFVFFDARGLPGEASDAVRQGVRSPAVIAAVCDRRNGVGADGVVFLEALDAAGVRITYYNRDGGRAALCGNATLCAARLAAELGAVERPNTSFVVVTDAGHIEARVPPDGDPVIALGPVRDVVEAVLGVRPLTGEQRVGYALVGVPHLVILVDDIEAVDVAGRGPVLRAATPERPAGANVNWVAPDGDRWRMRTFERGVEGETLACGTGAVACASLIARWRETEGPNVLVTASGRPVTVTPGTGEGTPALLAGEGRIVFRGELVG